MTDDLDISDVSKLRTNGGYKIMQIIAAADGIAYVDQYDCLHVVQRNGKAPVHGHSEVDLYLFDPWAGVELPTVTLINTQAMITLKDGRRYPKLMDAGLFPETPRTFRLVPVEDK